MSAGEARAIIATGILTPTMIAQGKRRMRPEQFLEGTALSPAKLNQKGEFTMKLKIDPELKATYQSALDQISANNSEVQRLQERIASLERGIDAKRQAVDQARATKDRVLAANATGTATDAELAAARDALDAAVKGLDNDVELLAAVQVALRRAEGQIPALNSNMLARKRKLYAACVDQLRDQLRSMQPVFELLQAAAVKSGADLGCPQPFLNVAPATVVSRGKELDQLIFG